MKRFAQLFSILLAASVSCDARSLRGASTLYSDSSPDPQSTVGSFSSQIILPYQPGYEIGQGVDAMAGFIRKEGAFYYDGPLYEEKIPSGSIQYYYVSNEQEVSDTTKDMIGFGVGAFGAQLSSSITWMSGTTVDTEDISFVFGQHITTRLTKVKPNTVSSVDSQLLADLKKAKESGDFKSFTDLYGTHYIAGKLYGGAAYSRIQVTAKTTEIKNSISTDLKASYGEVASPGGSVEFTNTISHLVKTQQITVESDSHFVGDVTVSGLGGLDMEAAKKGIYEFAQKVEATGGAPVAVLLDTWENLVQVEDIMKDDRMLPDLDTVTKDTITSAYAALLYDETGCQNIFTSAPWNTVPEFAKRKHRATAMSDVLPNIQRDMKRIRELSFYQLAALDPTSSSFQKNYGQAHKYHEQLVDIANFEIPIEYSLEYTKGMQDLDGPVSGTYNLSVQTFKLGKEGYKLLRSGSMDIDYCVPYTVRLYVAWDGKGDIYARTRQVTNDEVKTGGLVSGPKDGRSKVRLDYGMSRYNDASWYISFQ